MKLIVGLGNPGSKYKLTRHNIGFMVIDALATRAGVSSPQFKNEHKAETAKIRMNSTPVLLAKPLTYMNLSGESVQALVSYYDISMEDLLVIHDDVDLPFLSMKFQCKRGHGGQNGIRNIHQHLGSNEYARLKMGVGRPNGRMEVSDYVLQPFASLEMDELPDWLSTACDGVETFVLDGLAKAANEFNSKESSKGP